MACFRLFFSANSIDCKGFQPEWYETYNSNPSPAATEKTCSLNGYRVFSVFFNSRKTANSIPPWRCFVLCRCDIRCNKQKTPDQGFAKQPLAWRFLCGANGKIPHKRSLGEVCAMHTWPGECPQSTSIDRQIGPYSSSCLLLL